MRVRLTFADVEKEMVKLIFILKTGMITGGVKWSLNFVEQKKLNGILQNSPKAGAGKDGRVDQKF